MNTNERPISLELNVTITALVHPEPEAGGYSAEVPALPGCYAQGETLDEVRANLREAVEGWLDSAHDNSPHRRADPDRELRRIQRFWLLPAFGLLSLALGVQFFWLQDWPQGFASLGCALLFFAVPIWYHFRGEELQKSS